MSWRDIPGYFLEDDATDYMEVLNRINGDGGILVEIGSFQGRSAILAADTISHLGGRVVCVDPWTGEQDDLSPRIWLGPEHVQEVLANFRKNTEAYQKKGHIVECRMRSMEACALFKVLDIQDLCAVFIDGDHNYHMCAADFRGWYPLIKKGGFICGHDYNFETVARAVNEVAEELGERVIKPITGNSSIWVVPKSE